MLMCCEKSKKQFKSKLNIVLRIWYIRYILANCDYLFVNIKILEDLYVKRYGEDEVTCVHVEIWKYRNVEGYMCKKIEIRLRWHVYMLREFKLMTISEFYFYNYIRFMLVSAQRTNQLFRWTRDSAPTYPGRMEPRFGYLKISKTR
jgi:hypothetical protein